MSDTTQAAPNNVMRIPVTKSGGVVEIDTSAIPQDVYEAALAEGLKALVNKGMSKITLKDLEGAELAKAKAAAQAKAEENAAGILDGTIKLPGRKSHSKEPAEVMAEARRLAKNLVKDELKEANIRLKDVASKDLTAWAKKVLDSNPELITEARANVEARKESKLAGTINLKGLVGVSFDTLKASGEAAKAKAVERGKQLSAKQAGMPAKRKAKAPAQHAGH